MKDRRTPPLKDYSPEEQDALSAFWGCFNGALLGLCVLVPILFAVAC